MGENKYKNGKIYKIVDVGYNKCYIGSTCESLSKRMARHRSKYLYGSEKDKGRRINSLFDDFGMDNCKIELVEEYPCSNKMELLRQEGYHIRENECVNKIVAGRSSAEYWQEYSANNKEKIRENNKNWYQNNWKYRKEYRKEFNKQNKDKYHEYYESRKSILSEKHLCGCGMEYTHQHKKRHEKSQKHQDWLKQQEE